MRILLDTNIFIFYATDKSMLSKDIIDMIDNYENICLLSMESIKELVIAFKSKKSLSKYWRSAKELINSVQSCYGFGILPVDMNVMRTYSELETNVSQDHKDPSDHIIISQAITLGLPLVSSDRKFPFYRNQGLELIENSI